MSPPLVSVVTPFRNTAAYLAECIESVLAQNYSNFEYVLSDNCSTDGSAEIAETYARRDPRIRLIRQTQGLSQVRHYNAVLREISESSQYCKMVQADDYILPECLQLMVGGFERSESIGLVSSYYWKGNEVRGSGFPHQTPMLSGQEMVRLYLRTGLFVFGSPTTVMYRSSLVRKSESFYDESLLHEDTEKCVQILKDWDFGFVPQVLSFLRTDNESMSAQYRAFRPDALDRYILVQRYASAFVEPDEARALNRESRREYYDSLAHEGLRLAGSDFWQYHQDGLKTLGQVLDRTYLVLRMSKKVLAMAVNPGITARRMLRFLKDRTNHKD